jgi:tetratricopeptide (TPR) repeat protein
MTTTEVLEAIPIEAPVDSRPGDAARLLEQGLAASANDPHAAYMLAMAYKRQGKNVEARAALRKIAPPDANVLLQLGLLSLREKQYTQAEQELGRAWEMDPACFESGYNLLLTRLSVGALDSALALIPRVQELAPAPDERRFLHVLQVLLNLCQPGRGGAETNGSPHESALADMTAADEQRLVELLSGIDPFEVSYPLLRAVAAARPKSLPAQEACFQAALLEGKRLCERCDWNAASRLLGPLARAVADNRSLARPVQAAFFNLLGCAACMEQDFERGGKLFTTALRLSPDDARIHQNLALAYQWQNKLDHADPEWNRFLDLLDRRAPTPPQQPDYFDQLAFEGLSHVADLYSRQERWPTALNYLQQALRLRPDDVDLQERLFHLYTQLKRPQEASRMLYRMRKLRPHDPQLELYELDLHETKTLDDIDRMLGDVGRILKKYPNDLRVEDRAINMVANVIPLMGRLCDQLTDQIGKIIDQVRHLPSYQINWSAVREVMRDLEDEFLKLRQITRLCLPLVTTDEHRRIIRELSAHIDRKIEDCRRLGR